MSAKLTAYRNTHAGEEVHEPALPEFRRHVERGTGGPVDLARTVHLPVAAVRGAMSSFTDASHDRLAVRVCAGTSCMLADGRQISRELAKHRRCEAVYCLGYCDRSPAAMTPGGRVVTGLSNDHIDDLLHDRDVPHPAPPSIRCTARHAVVTARLLDAAPVARTCPDYVGLRAALKMTPPQVIDTIDASGLRGRGGAAYPTGRKWRLAAAAANTPKFVVANGDEGDPGSFIDRELMERDPHGILEGMAICARAIGATRGIVFIRSEYPVAAEVMSQAIEAAKQAGFLGTHALGRDRPFDVTVVRGMGSYVCGEETALLSAIEFDRGEVRPRPPYPVEAGVFGKPTVVDNVETLVDVPWIITHGAAAYAEMGTPESRGTKALCFNRGFARPGVVEVEFGVTLREAIESLGGGGAGGRPLEAVLLGGPMGSIVTADEWDVPMCFSAMGKRGINLGHAGLVAIPAPADWSEILRHLLAFMRDESCGKCVPCRLGSARAHELAHAGLARGNLPTLERILQLMKEASLCAFGRETPGPVRTILDKFGDRIMREVRP